MWWTFNWNLSTRVLIIVRKTLNIANTKINVNMNRQLLFTISLEIILKITYILVAVKIKKFTNKIRQNAFYRNLYSPNIER